MIFESVQMILSFAGAFLLGGLLVWLLARSYVKGRAIFSEERWRPTVDALQRQLKDLQSGTTDHSERIMAFEEQIAELSAEVKRRETEMANKVSGLVEFESENAALKDRLASIEENLKHETGHVHVLEEDHRRITKELDAREKRIHNVEQLHRSRINQKSEANEKLLGEKQRQIDELTKEVEKLQQTSLALQSRDSQIRELDHELEAERKRLSKVANSVEDLETKRAALTSALHSREAEVQERQARIDELQRELEGRKSQIRALEAEVGDMAEQVGELELLRRRAKAEDSDLRELARLREQLNDGRSELGRLRSEHGGVVIQKDAEIEALEKRLKKRPVVEKAGRAARRRQAKTHPLQTDDLKQIRGVGPIIEQTLNGMGYHTYRSIAEWTPADIERVTEKLDSLRMRIRRDRWISQAKQLHEEKHGEAKANVES